MNTITRNALIRNIYQEQIKSDNPEHIGNLTIMRNLIDQAFDRNGKASKITYEDLERVN